MQAQTTVPATPPIPHPGHSTGPRTPEGKARASQNALKHGLFSEALVIRGEAPEDFDSYQAEMIAAHRPYDLPEQEQVEVMVMMKWKLRRLWRQEPRLYGIYEAKAGQPDPDGAQALFDDSEQKRLVFTRLTRQEA